MVHKEELKSGYYDTDLILYSYFKSKNYLSQVRSMATPRTYRLYWMELVIILQIQYIFLSSKRQGLTKNEKIEEIEVRDICCRGSTLGS